MIAILALVACGTHPTLPSTAQTHPQFLQCSAPGEPVFYADLDDVKVNSALYLTDSGELIVCVGSGCWSRHEQVTCHPVSAESLP